jgi:3-deoxy-D-manno-octulosonic acid kinase
VSGFEERAERSRYLLVASAHAGAVAQLNLSEPAAVRDLLARETGATGRAHTAVVTLPGEDARLHLRPVRHGGLFAGLWGGGLLGLRRPIRELAVTTQLASAGAPVPEPVLVAGWRMRGPLWSAVVGTLHLEDSVDGVALLAATPDRARMLRAAEAAGRAVRRFHDAGGRHADLHVKNLLFREGGAATEAWVIDLDKARGGAPPGAGRRMRELMRLYRSLVKRGLLARVGARGCARFLGAYAGRDRALRRALRARLPRERLRVALHALAYRR